MRGKDVLDAIGNTPLVELRRMSPRPEVRIFAKLEGSNPTGSVKDRIVKHIIEQAEASGVLAPSMTIVEATTGNTGIALAMVGRRKGYRVRLAVSENVGLEIKQLLALYGAEVVWSDARLGTNGAIELANRMAQEPGHFLLGQFASQANPQAHYETTGVEILRDLPLVDVFVAGMGTAGTLMGVGRRLKEANPETRIIAVEPHADELVQGLRSLEDGFISPILDMQLLNGKMVVASREAFLATRELTRREGIFGGVSSGAVLHCALRVAEKMESGNIVVLFADGGWKYLSTRLWTAEHKEMSRYIDGKIWW
ncbi:MAG: cysteine synthase family protein [Chloroflexi bacterium]|nr:cysteine synthase family protein [Chloroflexota bacterium]